jgi:uncharacterized protein with HEPN domain
MKLIIIEVDGENEQFVLETNGNRVDIANTNHDTIGWAGMVEVRDAVTLMAKSLNIEIVHEDAPVVEKDEL